MSFGERIIKIQSNDKSLGGVPVGTIIWYAGNNVESLITSGEWGRCDGSVVQVNEEDYPELISLYGGVNNIPTYKNVTYISGIKKLSYTNVTVSNGTASQTTYNESSSVSLKSLRAPSRTGQINTRTKITSQFNNDITCIVLGIYLNVTRCDKAVDSDTGIGYSVTGSKYFRYASLMNTTSINSQYPTRTYYTINNNLINNKSLRELWDNDESLTKAQYENWFVVTEKLIKESDIDSTLATSELNSIINTISGWSDATTAGWYGYNKQNDATPNFLPMKTQMINFFTKLRDNLRISDNEPVVKCITMPNIAQGSTIVAGTSSNVRDTTNGKLPNITGTLYGAHDYKDSTGTSGAFSCTSTRLFGASGHNGVTIWGGSYKFDAHAANSIYDSSVTSVMPGGLYAIPLMRLK